MQNLVAINDGQVIIQYGFQTYHDTFENFILDGGEKLPDEMKSLDYNQTLKTCSINGEAFQVFPNEYAERVMVLVPMLCNAFEVRKKKREDAQRVEREETERIKREQEEIERLAKMSQAEKELMIQQQLTQAVQNVLDAQAQELNYDSCLSVCSYVDTGVQKFDDEGRAFRAWRSAVWAKGYEILAEVQAGTRAIPTEEELLTMLPELVINYSE